MDSTGPLKLFPAVELYPREPVVVVAYGGWNDGGESATMALRHLLGELSVSPLARIETEEFLDFTVARPHVRLRDEGGREIVWPNHEFFAARLEDQPHDLVLGIGIEPHLRWKQYSALIGELVRSVSARLVVLLGAYLADVIYSQPIQVRTATTDPELSRTLNVAPSAYEGPTGIVGVLGESLQRQGIRAVSLWASLPHYVSITPNPRGALALLQRLEEVTGLRLDLSKLREGAAEFDENVSELIASDPQLSAYVRELKKRAFSQ
jgi:proteasome assembly chaperone (PAC2) family protein